MSNFPGFKGLNAWKGCVLLLLACASQTALAQVSDGPTSEQVAALAQAPRWQALMHINGGATTRGVGNSYVDDSAFFLASDGKRNPVAELRASIEALRPLGGPVRCRFPARYRFIAESLGWQEERPLAHCEEFQNWKADVPTGQLVLIFPAAYLNSPSSMFGHTLLRLDTEADPDSTWLSLSINFGANTRTADNSIMYAWRGLAGGYPGHFSTVAYAKKIQDYSRVENRDIWEYALNLSGDEIQWLILHLWELKDINFDYFFLDENCSFRLLELIQVARPEAGLLEGWRFAEVPVKTVRTLYRAGMVESRRYRPSKASELSHLVDQLDRQERELASQLRDDPSLAQTADYRDLAPSRRQLVARTAYQALRLTHRKGARDSAAARRSLALLRLVKAEPTAAEVPRIDPPRAPEDGHDTQALTLSGGVAEGEVFAEFGYRLTYHDLLDPMPGFLPGTAIEGLDLRLRNSEADGLELEKLDLVDIRSLSPRNRFFSPISWFVNGGLERELTDEQQDQSLLLFLQGGPGLSWQFGPWLPYVLGVARLENIDFGKSGLEPGAGASAGLLYYGNGFQWSLGAASVYFDGGFYRNRLRLEGVLRLGRNLGLMGHCEQVEARHLSAGECGAGLRYFYD